MWEGRSREVSPYPNHRPLSVAIWRSFSCVLVAHGGNSATIDRTFPAKHSRREAKDAVIKPILFVPTMALWAFGR